MQSTQANRVREQQVTARRDNPFQKMTEREQWKPNSIVDDTLKKDYMKVLKGDKRRRAQTAMRMRRDSSPSQASKKNQFNREGPEFNPAINTEKVNNLCNRLYQEAQNKEF